MGNVDQSANANKNERIKLSVTRGLTLGKGLCTHSSKKTLEDPELVLLPASDQEEECEDDEEGEATDCCRDDDQHLPLVGCDV